MAWIVEVRGAARPDAGVMSSWRVKVAVGLSVAVGALAMGSPASASIDQNIVPAQVLFSATGTYTIDQGYAGGGGSCSTTDTGKLAWVVSYDTKVVYGALQNAPGTMATSVGPGNLSLSKGGICNYLDGGCTAALSAGGYPQLNVTGDDPAHLEAQSLTAPLSFNGCSGADNQAFMGRDVYTLNAALPGATTALANVPASVLSAHNSNYTVNVDSGTAPEQVTSDCTGVAPGTGNTSCSASLTWSGTVTVMVCTVPGQAITQNLPYCLGHQKAEARAQANSIRAITNGFSAKCPDGVSYAVCKLSEGTSRSLLYSQADDDDKIADDPPDAHYAAVAQPTPPTIRKLAVLNRRVPAFGQWAGAYAAAIGYENALVTSLNRQTGAADAFAQGLQSAGGLALQRNAIYSDARHAATLLASADSLAQQAASQLKTRLHVSLPLTKLAGVQKGGVAMLRAVANRKS